MCRLLPNQILLVDWASTTIPRTLVEAGFKVFCASPGGYSLVELVSEEAAGINSTDVFPPKQNENRPENEHEGIIANHVVPLGAKVVWLQPSIASGTARRLGLEYGFDLVDGVDIAGAAR